MISSVSITLDKVIKFAKQARVWGEKEAKKLNYPPTLGGLCGKVSAYLHKTLKENNIPSSIVYGDGHVWCRVNNWHIDCTATQFGIDEEIFILDNSEIDLYKSKYPCYTIFGEYQKLEDFIQRQYSERWPIETILEKESI